MSCKAAVRQVGGVAIIELSGRITLGDGSGLVRGTIKGLLNEGRRDIVLDLKGVTYMDSAGLGELVGSYASVSSAGGSIKLLHPQGRVGEVLAVTKLYTVFETFHDERSAVASFGGGAAAG